MTLERIENLISHVLRMGVIASLLVIVAGTILSFMHHPGYLWPGHDLAALTTPGAPVAPTLATVWAGVLAGQGQALVMAGLLLLIATPVVRVAISIVVFALQRDWIFVTMTAVVFLTLLVSFWVGRAE